MGQVPGNGEGTGDTGGAIAPGQAVSDVRVGKHGERGFGDAVGDSVHAAPNSIGYDQVSGAAEFHEPVCPQQQACGTVGNPGIGFGLDGLQLVPNERHGALHDRLRVHIGGDVRQCGKRRVNAAEEISGGVHRVHHTGQLVDDRSVASHFLGDKQRGSRAESYEVCWDFGGFPHEFLPPVLQLVCVAERPGGAVAHEERNGLSLNGEIFVTDTEAEPPITPRVG